MTHQVCESWADRSVHLGSEGDDRARRGFYVRHVRSKRQAARLVTSSLGDGRHPCFPHLMARTPRPIRVRFQDVYRVVVDYAPARPTVEATS